MKRAKLTEPTNANAASTSITGRVSVWWLSAISVPMHAHDGDDEDVGGDDPVEEARPPDDAVQRGDAADAEQHAGDDEGDLHHVPPLARARVSSFGWRTRHTSSVRTDRHHEAFLRGEHLGPEVLEVGVGLHVDDVHVEHGLLAVEVDDDRAGTERDRLGCPAS